MSRPKTIIVGLGNPYLGDDGIGVVIATLIQDELPVYLHENLEVTEASVGGLRLMETLVGYERAILIDALDVLDPTPGRCHRWNMEDLIEIAPTQHSASAHDTNLPTAIAAGRKMGLKLPVEIAIFAVEVQCTDEFSEDLTPEVENAIPDVIQRVLKELELEPVAV